MGLIWNQWGLLGVIALVLAVAMAAFVFRAAPNRSVNRRLALVLLVEGITVTVCAAGLDIFLTSASDYYGTQVLHAMSVLAIPILYLIFLGAALETPLVRPLKHRAALPALIIVLLALESLVVLYPERFIVGLTQPWYAPWALEMGPWFLRAIQFWGIVSAYGLVAGIDAYRRSRTNASRQRMRAYVFAFGLRDVYWMVLLFVIIPHMDPFTSRFWGIVFTQGMSLGTIVFVLLIGYGILKTQLFDIDIKLKWTVQKSTMAAAFLAAFFVVSEGAAAVFESTTGSTAAGLGAAGLLVFAMAPLQRLAERVSNAAMPGVQNTPEYTMFRKFEVYKGAIESAHEDGLVTEKERTILDRLARDLGIESADARSMERDVLATISAAV